MSSWIIDTAMQERRIYEEGRAAGRKEAADENERLRAENKELRAALDWVEKGIDPSGLDR